MGRVRTIAKRRGPQPLERLKVNNQRLTFSPSMLTTNLVAFSSKTGEAKSYMGDDPEHKSCLSPSPERTFSFSPLGIFRED